MPIPTVWNRQNSIGTYWGVPEGIQDSLLLETGDYLLLENGFFLTIQRPSSTWRFLLEDGEILILESGDYLILQDG